MKRLLCCFKGGSSSNGEQDPRQGPSQGPPQGPSQGPSQGPPQGPPQAPPQAPPQGPSQGPSQAPPQAPPQGPPQGPPQDPPQDPLQGPPQPPEQQPEHVSSENSEVYDDAPVEKIWRKILIRNNLKPLEVADSGAVLFPIPPPLPATCGESFRWHEILDATINFRHEFFLGGGNFGEVYHCNFLRTNQVGAVKIQNQNNPTGHFEFVAEVTTLHEANHPHVIKLLGKCDTPSDRAIIYEFMPNGSLERHLFAQARQGQRRQGLLQPARDLDWETRMKIAVGVAEGLVYVHQELKVINRDVKAGNILLDQNFVPKLTDFGLATKIVRDENGIEQQSKITPLKGTPGSIAPEAEESGLVSTKTDVYSYGVLLLALFTGRKAFDSPVVTKKLTDWLMPVWTRVEYEPLVVDVKLGKKFSVEALNKIFHTARMCIHAQALERPDMDVVVTMVREAAALPVQQVPRVKRRRSDV